ncbi:MAG: penicillin-binding protein 2 [Candidatus Saccharibacteria bacterium]|nr:penicillin-binding protein 2 [Candidatus Saccharibacteria bacterium]
MQWRLSHSRTTILAIALLGVMAIFVLRLFYLQIIKHAEYTALARASQQKNFVIPATRGTIYMMDGKVPAPVVLNEVVYTMIADPQAVKDDERSKIIAALREVAGGEMTAKAEEQLGNKRSRYEVLARNLTRSQAEKLKKKDFVGVLYQRGTKRSYPEGDLGAHVLGFVNAEGKGQYGIEGGLDKRLKGQDGLLRTVTDVRNVPLTISKDNIRVEPKAGEDIVLSVDRNVQEYAAAALKRGMEKAHATEGSVVVMNPNNGQVLAMANYPTFHPGEYGKTKDAAAFVNAITMMPHEPASIIKTFTMATGIDRGVITPSSTYYNSDCTKVGDRTICNAVRGQVGTLTMQQALNNSHNVGTTTVGRRLGNGERITTEGRRTIYDYFHHRFGFGTATGIEMAETDGIIHGPDSVEGNEVRYANMTFGQGMNITTLQVAAAFCSVVNGGEYYRPTVVAGVMTPEHKLLKAVAPRPVRRTISPETSATMRQMLDVTRHSFFVGNGDRPGYQIGGKTGTAELLVDGTYTKRETAGTYLGYGGADKPEYVIMIRVAAPGRGIALEGSVHASPIFTDISNWMIDYMKLPPRSDS